MWVKKFFDLSTPSPISSFGGTWWWTNSTIPPKNPPPYGTHVLLGNRQSYHYLVRHLLGFWWWFLKSRKFFFRIEPFLMDIIFYKIVDIGAKIDGDSIYFRFPLLLLPRPPPTNNKYHSVWQLGASPAKILATIDLFWIGSKKCPLTFFLHK